MASVVPSAPAPLAEPDPPPPTIDPRVSARFPPPPVVYRTPGLAPNRARYTTEPELQLLMRALVRDGAATGGTTVRLLNAGRSQLGTPIEALLFTDRTDFGPQALREAARPTVLLIAGQQGDGPAATEALLVMAQRLASGVLQPLLGQINVVLVPRANPDAAARARRDTANGIDMSRDHLLLRTPEARALAQLVADYRPLVVVDAHEYPAVGRWRESFGVIRRHDVLLQHAMTPNLAEFVTRAAQEWFRDPLVAGLTRARLESEWYHQLDDASPVPVVSMGSARPDSSRNVSGLRNAIGLLVRTRGADLGRIDLQRRVHGQVVSLTSILESTASRAADLHRLRNFVDSDVAARACKGEVVIEAAPTPSEYELTALDPVTGADRALIVNWQSSLALTPLRTRSRPCGYWLAADQVDAVQRLRALGLEVHTLLERTSLRGETYRVLAEPLRTAQPVRESADRGAAQPVPVDVQAALIDAEAGSFFVPLTQPHAALAVAALEPDSPSSYLAHGLIDRPAAVARATSLPPPRP